MLQSLQNQLREFGLNPLDWKTFPITDEVYAIVHRTEQDLIFTGLVGQSKGCRVWQELSLLEFETTRSLGSQNLESKVL